MLDAETEAMSGELAEHLAANERVDPRTIATRFSLLKQMARSPAHYYHAAQQPQDDSIAARLAAAAPTGTKRGDALRFGSACHLMLLGEDSKVKKFTGGRRAGKAWDDFQHIAAAEGAAEILNEREHALASGIVDAVRRKPGALRLLLEDTTVEQRIDWQWLGKEVRSTPDARSMAHVVDLKTAMTAQPAKFVRTAMGLHYHAQAALYSTAIEHATGSRPGDAYVIAVEKMPPHPVTILRFTDRVLELGERCCRLWMEQLLVCEESNQWPEYLDTIGDFDIEDDFAIEIDGQRFDY